VFAAFLPESLVRETIKAELADGRYARRIGETISYSLLRPDLKAIRTSGYATIKDPPVPGIHALSAPVFDHVGQMLMAVTLIGHAEALDVTATGAFVPVLLRFTGMLSAKLGYEQRGNRG
jgi:DNA-binding IclR family transcriptional regulator